MNIKKICLICGKEFEVPQYRENAKYCSPECRQEALKGELNCTCEVCGKKFHLKPYRLNKNKHCCCSRECLNILKQTLYSGEGNHQYGLKGELNASFKGLEITNVNNNIIDILVYDPTHPYANRYGRVTKHRLIVEQNYKMFDYKYFEEINGRVVLKKYSHVHHIDGDHNNNDITNLIPVTRAEHRRIHNSELEIIRDSATGRITGVIKRGELLEKPEVANQQPSLGGNALEGSETSGRVQLDSNAATSAPPDLIGEDIVRPTDITNETVELQDKELVR